MGEELDSARPFPAGLKKWRVFIPIGILYCCFGTIVGFLQGGIPPILRATGSGLESLSVVYALYLPFGLTFLWAPLVDSTSITRLPRRTGWIVLGQAMTALMAFIAAISSGGPALGLFFIGLGAAVSIATMDVALDALTVELTPRTVRASAGAVKVGALAVGAVLGGGVLVGQFERLGWQITFVILGSAILASTLPIFTLVREELKHGPPTPNRANLRRALERPRMARRVIISAALSVALVLLFYLNRVMLVDLGVPLPTIGWIVGILAPLANLAASASTPFAITRHGIRGALWAFVAMSLIATLIIIVALWARSQPLALAGTLLVSAGISSIIVVLYTVMLGWAAGGQSATDYAALYGLSRLAGTVALIGTPWIVGSHGWISFYAIVAALLLTATWAFDHELSKGDRISGKSASKSDTPPMSHKVEKETKSSCAGVGKGEGWDV